MSRKGIVGVVVFLGVLMVGFVLWVVFFMEESLGFEGDCVPASCCHAVSCVWENEAPDCSDVFCTASCEDGTLDCGAGECRVVGGSCEVVWNG